VRWDPRTLYSKIFDDPAERDWFLNHVCTMGWHLAHDRGVTFEENRIELIARFPRFEAQIRAWGDRFMEMVSDPFPETEAAIEALEAAGVPQFALTNMSVSTWRDIVACSPVFGRLAGAVVSAAEGIVKPDPAIFRLACDRFGLAPEALLFVDDSAANIEAAGALGFRTHHFTDPAALAPDLKAQGLL
jgi:2-haloacid dehalogenase/putative hydrolase of the HAD superfamily